jgi:hypothetical protein
VQGMWLSPRIADLHAQGVVRYVGALGMELESVHKTSELCGKSVAFTLLVFVVLAVWSDRSSPAANVSGS